MKHIALVFILIVAIAFAKYTPPTIHPFGSREELLKEEKRDPFGFNTDKLIYSHVYMRYLQQNQKDDPNFRPATLNVAGVYETYDNETRTKIVQKVNANIFTGIVNFDDYKEQMVRISCPSEKELIITTNTMRDVQEWIPGTRFVISEHWKCHSTQDKPIFRLLVRRNVRRLDSATETYEFSFETEDLEMWDLFEDADITVERHVLSKEAQPQENLKFGLFSFNWDFKEERVIERNIPIFQNQYVDVLCSECYAYIQAEVAIKIKFSWRSGVSRVYSAIIGKGKLFYDIYSDARFACSKQVDKTLFYKPKALVIRFNIGPIPIWIDFDLALKLKNDFVFNTAAQLTLQGDFWDTLTLGMEYDKSREQRFNFFLKNEHSDFKGLIPKVKFDGRLHVTDKLNLIPEVEVKFFSSAGVKLGLVPYLDGEAKAEYEIERNECPKNQLSWDLAFGLNAYAQMQPLKIFKFKTDFGGRLPYPNPLKEYTLVQRKTITKGCYPLPSP
jgi:hypothetical protein